MKGRIVIDGPDWRLPKGSQPSGHSPAISPSGDTVAFLRYGNLYLLRKGSPKPRQLTTLSPSADQSAVALPMRVSWHPSGQWIVFTRALPSEYNRRSNSIRPITRKLKPNEIYIESTQTIWLADVKSGKARQIVGLMGNPRKLESQIEGASVYEPLFSPDGKSIWFLNGGWLYQASVDTKKITAGKSQLVARIGNGLDFESPGASRSGSGAQMLAWNARASRLCYWVGRFWGTGVSEYGYIQWKNGSFGHPEKWHPQFAQPILNEFNNTNVSGCVFDDKNNLWVNTYYERGARWVRGDDRAQLPPGSGRPDWDR